MENCDSLQDVVQKGRRNLHPFMRDVSWLAHATTTLVCANDELMNTAEALQCLLPQSVHPWPSPRLPRFIRPYLKNHRYL